MKSSFLKNINKRRTKKKKIIALDTFFNFLLCFFLQKIKKVKVGQKNWTFNIFHVCIAMQVLVYK
jgi:hypothetical protein